MTIHRIGLFRELGISLKTTNCIGSLMVLIGQKTNKVDYWKTSDHLPAAGREASVVGYGSSGHRAKAQKDKRISISTSIEDRYSEIIQGQQVAEAAK